MDFKFLIFIYLFTIIRNKIVMIACSAAIPDTAHKTPSVVLSLETISSLVF
jgi:hypothetical protein